MALLQSFKIFSPATQSDLLAELHRGVSTAQLDSIKRDWSPILERQLIQAKVNAKLCGIVTEDIWQAKLDQFGCPDARWDWHQIADPGMLGISRQSFCIESEDKIQAVMRVSLTERCHLPTQKGEHMIYVDYLAVAPWNRQQIEQPIRCQGLGTIMLGVAISLSRDEGWRGRVGLHSLPQAESFYLRKGMIAASTGSPDTGTMKYFEYTEDAANDFLPPPESNP